MGMDSEREIGSIALIVVSLGILFTLVSLTAS